MAITLNIDGETKGINEKLDAIAKNLGKVEDSYDKVNQAGKEVFDAANKSASTLISKTNDTIKTLNNQGKAFADLKTKIAETSAVAGKGFDPKRAEAYAKAIDQVKKVFNGTNFSITLDAAKQKALENMIENAKDDLEVLKIVIKAAKDELNGFDKGSQEFKELSDRIEVADSFLKELGLDTEQTATKSKSLKAQLRGIKEELAQMESQGQDTEEKFLDLQVAAGRLEDQIGDTATRVRALVSDTKNIDAGIQAVQGLAGAFATFQGITALLGQDEEELQKALLKVNAAMSVLQGIQAVAQVLQKNSILNTVLENALRKKSIADILTEAGVRRVINAQLIIENALQSKSIIVRGAAAIAQRALNLVMAANPVLIVVAALTALIGALALFTDNAETAEEAQARLNSTLENSNTVYGNAAEQIIAASEKRVAILKKNGAAESKILQENIDRDVKVYKTFNDQIALLKEKRDKEILPENRIEINKAIEQKVFEQKKKYADLEIKLIEKETQVAKEAEDAKKKEREETDKLQKDRLERQKAINDQMIKLSRELRDAQIAGIEDQFKRDKELTIESANRKIQDLENEKTLTKAATEVRNNLIVQLRKNLANELVRIDAEEAAERAKIATQSQIDILSLQEDNTAKEIELVKLAAAQQLAEYEVTYKDQQDTLSKLRIGLAEKTQRQIEEITIANTQKDLQMEEEREILRIELLQKFSGTGTKIEEAKQQEILRVKIAYAKKNLDFLIASGKTENDISVLQAEKLINDLEKELNVIESKKGKRTIFDLLGIDVENQDEAIANLKQTLNTFTSFIQDSLNKQLITSQQVVQQRKTEVDSARQNLQDQIALSEEGLANDKELAAQKLQIAKEAEQKAIEDNRKAAQQQFILDTLIQASNLAVAATEIYRRTAKDPITTGIATVTVAAMIAAFLIQRKKAAEAVKLEKGDYGVVDGKRHAQGGERFGDHIEVEGGEAFSVYNRRATMRHNRFLNKFTDLVNSNPQNLHAELFELLAANNIGTSMATKTDDVDLKFASVNNTFNVKNDNKDLKEAAIEMKKAASELNKKEKVTHYEWGYIIQNGNNIKKVKYSK